MSKSQADPEGPPLCETPINNQHTDDADLTDNIGSNQKGRFGFNFQKRLNLP